MSYPPTSQMQGMNLNQNQPAPTSFGNPSSLPPTTSFGGFNPASQPPPHQYSASSGPPPSGPPPSGPPPSGPPPSGPPPSGGANGVAPPSAYSGSHVPARPVYQQYPSSLPQTQAAAAAPPPLQQQQLPHPQSQQFNPLPSHPQSAPSYPQTQPHPQAQPQAPMQPPAPAPSQGSGGDCTKRINPDHIPAPAMALLEADAIATASETARIVEYRTDSGANPPSSLSHFVSVDSGSSGAEFIRSSLYTVPISQELHDKSCIPLGCIISPLAEVRGSGKGGDSIPVVSLQGGPLRCSRCRAYINPYCQFVDSGHKFVCNICGVANDVGSDYFAHLDAFGKRRDLVQRPELTRGTVDFVATDEFIQRKPLPLAHVFLLDISQPAVASGALQSSINTLKATLPTLPAECEVAFIGYSTALHFFTLNADTAQVQHYIVPDLQEPFLPVPSGLLLPTRDTKTTAGVLEMLQSLAVSLPQSSAVSLGAALLAAQQLLADRGGKITAICCSLPELAPGEVSARDDAKLRGTDKEKTLLTPATGQPFYTTLGTQCMKKGISVDLWLLFANYFDTATLAPVCSLTGGNVYYYSNFGPMYHRTVLTTFCANLHSVLHQARGYDGVMRIRCSSGLDVDKVFGHVDTSAALEIPMPFISSETAVSATLQYLENLEPNKNAYLQVALLYTSVEGLRRIRLLNLSLNTSNEMQYFFRSADCDTVVSVLTKMAVAKAKSTALTRIRDEIREKSIDILSSYRKYCNPSANQSQLVLPDKLRNLPAYMNGLTHSLAIRDDARVSPDARVAALTTLTGALPHLLLPYLYPRVTPALRLVDNIGLKPESGGPTEIPGSLRCSTRKLDSKNVYLIDNGQVAIVWLGMYTPQSVLADLFGVDTLPSGADVAGLSLTSASGPRSHSQRIRNMLDALCVLRRRSMPLLYCVEGDPSEVTALSLLVEDQGTNLASFVDFLCGVHNEIITRMQANSSTFVPEMFH